MLKLLLFLLFINIKRLGCDFAKPQQIEDVYFAAGRDEILRCPAELAVTIKPEIVELKKNKELYIFANKLRHLVINNYTTVEWLKADGPMHRVNGNFFLPKNDQSPLERVMHNVDCSDEGKYTCKYNFTFTDSRFHDFLKLVPKHHFNLHVDDSIRVDVPVITHAPYDQVVHKGSEATFKCTHMETTVAQEFEWFRLLSTNFTGADVTAFLNAINRTVETKDPSLLSQYLIHHGQDLLKIHNVSDESLGFYGCYVAIPKALELRYGSLKIVSMLQTLPSTHYQPIQWSSYFMFTMPVVVLILVIILVHNIKLGFPKREKIITVEQNGKATAPVYDYPPSTGTAHFNCSFLKSSCVVNPIYGLAQSLDPSDWSKFRKRNINDQEIIFLDKIGEGQFGEVHRCLTRFKDGTEKHVAVKMLRSQFGIDTLSFLGSERDRKDLIAEIEIMKLLTYHQYVVKMLDFFVTDGQPILLIMELVKNGKLQTYLRDSRTYLKSTNDFDSYITSRDLIKFSYQVAKGMEYVASQGIIHRDLASRNILITEDRICKVADFGFARRITDECAYERTNGDKVPVRWMAPEALLENKFTSKSDVFSFGILIWEIVTLGSTPYESLTSAQVLQKVKIGGRLERPPHCKAELFDVMSKCWIHNPSDRPSFGELAIELEKLLMSENDYIELNQYPNHAYYNILTDKSDEKL